MVMRNLRLHTGKWNASKYKILSTLIWIGKAATCAAISHWSGLPVKSIWRDIWRYHQLNYVRQVGYGRPYLYRITVKGRRFIKKMKELRLIDTNRLDDELEEHRFYME